MADNPKSFVISKAKHEQVVAHLKSALEEAQAEITRLTSEPGKVEALETELASVKASLDHANRLHQGAQARVNALEKDKRVLEFPKVMYAPDSEHTENCSTVELKDREHELIETRDRVLFDCCEAAVEYFLKHLKQKAGSGGE